MGIMPGGAAGAGRSRFGPLLITAVVVAAWAAVAVTTAPMADAATVTGGHAAASPAVHAARLVAAAEGQYNDYDQGIRHIATLAGICPTG